MNARCLLSAVAAAALLAGCAGTTLHRIDEALVRQEVEAAGFKFVASADFLRNANDARDISSIRAGIRVDEFELKFVKP